MDDPVFDRFREAQNPEANQAKALEQLEQQRKDFLAYFGSLLEQNSSRPVRVHSVVSQGSGSNHTRSAFLQAQVEPLLATEHTVQSLVQSVDDVYKSLASLGIYDSIHLSLDTLPPSAAALLGSSDPQTIDLRATLQLDRAKTFVVRTGADFGNGEGGAYVNATVKNLFGGAEQLALDAKMGADASAATRTRSSYILSLTSPLNNSRRWAGEFVAYSAARKIPWASGHDQLVNGFTVKAKTSAHELGLEVILRTLSLTQDVASDALKRHAGHGIKTALTHAWSLDTRDSPMIPTSGYYFKLCQELAGLLGPENGDRPFFKASVEGQVATSWNQRRSSLSLSGQGGFLWMQRDTKSHFMDRFFLGGPNSVRAFDLNGLGPWQGQDHVGGEAFVATGLSAMLPLPRWIVKTPDLPLKFHSFVNAGSVVPINQADLSQTWRQLLAPSVGAGFGLVYSHQVARFELNLTMPIVAHRGDNVRKGVQFGVGLAFL